MTVLIASGWTIAGTPPPLESMTYGQCLAALYLLQEWEAANERRADDPYAPRFFANRAEAVLRGLENGTRQTAMHHLGQGLCVGCSAPVDLRRTEGDHMIARHFGGPDSVQNGLLMCRPCNSSKGTKDFIQWWMWKQKPVMALGRREVCLYTRIAWQFFGVQVHREPSRSWLQAFLVGRAAPLPSEAHRRALYLAAQDVCARAQGLPAPQLSVMAMSSTAVVYLSVYAC